MRNENDICVTKMSIRFHIALRVVDQSDIALVVPKLVESSESHDVKEIPQLQN